MNNISKIENIIGYSFNNKKLLEEAFTHSSYANDKGYESYDRLEFLGDAIVDFTIGEYLFYKYDGADAGTLTDMRKKLVSKGPLVECIKDIKLDNYIMVSKSLKLSLKMISDIFESITAAIYLDSNMENSKKFVLDKLTPYVDKWLQKIDVIAQLGEKYINYKFIDIGRFGPDHIPSFIVALEIDGQEKARATASTKHDAKKLCAANVLQVPIDKIL